MFQKDVQDFLALVRRGLGLGKEENYAFEALNWENIIELAKRQTVLGVVAEASVSLDEKVRPPKDVQSCLLKFSFANVNSHLLLDKSIKRVFSDLAQENIPAVLLKGQSLCPLYPSAYMRQCGDIDLYVNPEHFSKALKIAKEKWIIPEKKESTFKHYHFSIGSVSIDLHHTPAIRFIPWKKQFFQKWLHEQLRLEKCHDFEEREEKILIPSDTFNAFFLFYHAWFHFTNAKGVGLRQLCDWTLWLQKRCAGIDKEELKYILENLGLMRPWQIMGMTCVKYLGLDKDKLPFFNPSVKKDAERMMELILEEGNFGNYAKGIKESRRNKFAKLLRVTRRNLRILRMSPIQVSCRYVTMLYSGLKSSVAKIGNK